MSFEFLFEPVEEIDAWLTGLFDGAPLLVALGIAFVLGLRHASDPDHLVAVTSLVASEQGDTRAAARLGAWWGVGHALTLVVIGLPLIAFKSELPAWLESAAEKGVGIVILLLALRVLVKWVRGDFRAGRHEHGSTDAQPRAPASAPRGWRTRPCSRALSATGLRHRAPARPRGHRRGRAASDRRPSDPAGGSGGPGRVRSDVDPLDGAAHHRLRVGPDPADRRADLSHRPDSRSRRLRAHVRAWYAGIT